MSALKGKSGESYNVGSGINYKNIDLVIPKTINFVHKCYINIAREIWKNPYLFDDYVSGSEYQKNMRTVEIMIKESIENTNNGVHFTK